MNKIEQYWKQLSIKVKLLSYFFVVIIIVSLFNLYLNNNNYKIMDQFNNTMNNYYTINQLLVLSSENKETLNNYLRDLDQTTKIGYESSKLEIQQVIMTLYQRFDSIESYFQLTAISNSSKSYFDLWDQAIIEREDSVETYYNKLYEGENIEKYTKGYIEELLYLSLSEGTKLYNQLAKEAELMRRISFILILGVTFFAMLIGLIFANSLVKPIKKLARASLKISSGDLDVGIIEKKSEDEVGVLTDSFNAMSISIKNYVTDLKQKVIIEKKLHEEELEVIRMEQLVQDAQFQALQSQINPHFLFNTLNTISRTAMFEEAETTQKLIQALSRLFRYRLRRDSELIHMEEEIEIIREYVYLQQMRFKERLTFDVVIDEDSKDFIIPIFSLQPIVENAIIHGIEPKIEGGHVHISITSKHYLDSKDWITRIEVSDTGVGMSSKRLKEVLSFQMLNKNSIGIGNVYHRFMLTYGNTTRFDILSEEGEGSTIVIEFIRKSGDIN